MSQPYSLFVTRNDSDPGASITDGLAVSASDTVYSEVFHPKPNWSLQARSTGGLVGTWTLWASDLPHPDPNSDTDWVNVSSHAGFVEDNPASARAELDLDITWGGLDTIVQANLAGTDGNAITITTVADGSGAGSFTRSGTALTFHYETAVTTVANFETAVGALAGADDIIGVKTTGTGATVLTAPGDTKGPVALAGGTDDEVNFHSTPDHLYARRLRLKFVASSTSGDGTLYAYATNHN